MKVSRENKTIAYLRVSTIEQDLQKDRSGILELANNYDLGKVTFVEEKVSGKVSWRNRQIAEVMDELHSGDNLIVTGLSRLGRSMLECMEILSIATQKDIHVFAIKGNWQLNNSLQSKIVAMAFSMASEIERDLISFRTREALNVKKRAGMKLGRPVGKGKSKLDKHKEEITGLLMNGATKVYVAKKYGAANSTIHNWLKKNRMVLPIIV